MAKTRKVRIGKLYKGDGFYPYREFFEGKEGVLRTNENGQRFFFTQNEDVKDLKDNSPLSCEHGFYFYMMHEILEDID